jgi:ABC-2 type transport system ATP-binding protein
MHCSTCQEQTSQQIGSEVLTVIDVHKSYRAVKALDGVSIDLGPGEILGLLGPNGAGKTTLVSLIAGLRRPDAGIVRVAGLDVAQRPEQARKFIGLAPQDLGIYPVVSVRDNLAVFGEIAGVWGPRLRRRIDELAERLRIEHLLDRLAGSLSGGEKRRLHTAIALLHEPPLALLDEPTTGADVATRYELLSLVKDLAAAGSAVLYSTHYLGEVETLGASVAILDRGRLIATGALQELIASYAETAVELTFDGPLPDLQLDGLTVAAADSAIRITTDDPSSAVARAIAAIGPAAKRLRSVEVFEPSLEAVFLNLTGRRYSGEEARGSEKLVS